MLCKQNPARRCTGNFAPKYWVGDRLLAKCEGEIQVGYHWICIRCATSCEPCSADCAGCLERALRVHNVRGNVGQHLYVLSRRAFPQIELLDALSGQRVTEDLSGLRLEV